MPSRTGLGLAAVARPAYITAVRDRDLGDSRSVQDLRRRTHDVLDAAYAAGVRYADVARSYGRSEEFLAQWLDARGATDVEVGSKWGYRYVGGWRVDATVHEVKDHSLSAFEEQLAQTRAVLGDRLDVHYVHSATLESGALTDGALHRALGDLRDSGVRVGVSTSGPRQGEAVLRALDVRVGGDPLFTSVQSTWNLLEPSAGPALAEAHARGARVIIKEVVANGRLVPGGDDGSDGVRRAVELADRVGAGVDGLAAAAALAQPWAWRVLSGAVVPQHVQSAVAAERLVLPPDVVDALPGLAEEPGAYWSARSRRPWA